LKTLVWRRLDEPGMEVAHVESFSRASGTQLGVSYEMRWTLDGDRLTVEVIGGASMTISLDGADFFDVFASPFFNSLPVVWDGLLGRVKARDYVMRFVQVPELTVVESTQRYESHGDRMVRYSSGTFEADIEFDEDGFVLRYDRFLERLA